MNLNNYLLLDGAFFNDYMLILKLSRLRNVSILLRLLFYLFILLVYFPSLKGPSMNIIGISSLPRVSSFSSTQEF